MPNLDKLQRQWVELKNYVDTLVIPVNDWHFAPGDHPGAAAPDFEAAGWQIVSPPLLWGGYNEKAWFRKAISVPSAFRGHAVRLRLDLVDQHGEALLYVQGQPFQGIDRNHTEVLLTPRAKGDEVFFVALEAASFRIREKRHFRSALLVCPDEGVRALCTLLKNGLDLLQVLSKSHPDRDRLLNILFRAMLQMDWRHPGSAAFRESAARAAQQIAQAFQRLHSDLPARLVPAGHAHIDVVWLWTLQEVKHKCGCTFSTVVRLMEQYPEYHFVQSQPQLYQMTREAYPAIFEKIKQRVRQGQWEPVGAMWVEPDCNLPSGESLVRQIIHGKKFFREQFGVEVDNLWLPDAFGYSAALPQILRKAGIKYFFTAKLAWNDVNPFPHSAFWWRGIDGSSVLVYLTFLHNLYNSEIMPADLQEAWQTYKQKKQGGILLLPYGFGDGGGGPTEAHLQNARWLADMPGLPKFERISVRDFFHRLEKQASDFPVWWGELYFEYHRGTLTTHAEIKRWNRKCEFLLREAEFFISLSQLLGAGSATPEQPAWPQDLHTAWQKLLLNQFHDILPGSSILEVYDQALSDYRDIAGACERLISRAAAQFLPSAQKTPAHALAIFNALNWERTEPVEIFLPIAAKEVAIFDSQNHPVPKQVLQQTPSGQRLLIQPQVPATGYETITVLEQKNRQADSSLKVSQRAMENRWFRLRLNANGQILSLWDKQQAREVIAPGEKANVLEAYEDLPANWEAWDIDADYVYKPLSLFRCREVSVEETGPLRAAVRFTHRSENSTISQRIVLYEALPRIDFETEVDWHEQRVLLKVAFPVAVLSPHATYEIQFGALERTTHTNTSWDAARFEVVGHKWADLSEGDYGVSLLNDCKYGYDVRDHRLRLTLLRSPFPPDPLVAGPHVDYRQATDQGTHRFVYSLYPHPGNWRQAQTVRRAYELNLPLRCMPLDHRKKLSQPPRFSCLSVDQSNIIMEVLKPAFDGPGIILRLYESSGQRGRCRLRIVPFPQKIELCDLLENPIRAISCQPDRCQIEYAPFEILTLKLSYGSPDYSFSFLHME